MLASVNHAPPLRYYYVSENCKDIQALQMLLSLQVHNLQPACDDVNGNQFTCGAHPLILVDQVLRLVNVVGPGFLCPPEAALEKNRKVIKTV